MSGTSEDAVGAAGLAACAAVLKKAAVGRQQLVAPPCTTLVPPPPTRHGAGRLMMTLAGIGLGCARIQAGPAPPEGGTPPATDVAVATDAGMGGDVTADVVVFDTPAPRGLVDGDVPEIAATPVDAACSREIKAVVRDFRGYSAASGARHPDFEGTAFTSHKGIVGALLGPDRKPVYAPAGATPATTGPAAFADWYHDVAGVNMRFDDVVLPLTPDPARPTTYVYDDQMFFPISGRGWAESFGDNFHFTTEIHLEFPYQGGEIFTFIGDDDLFLFINGRLAIDLGGVHPAQSDSVNLDARATELGIERGRTYPMDIFHAERHTTFSTFRIETTIQCLTSIIIP